MKFGLNLNFEINIVGTTYLNITLTRIRLSSYCKTDEDIYIYIKQIKYDIINYKIPNLILNDIFKYFNQNIHLQINLFRSHARFACKKKNIFVNLKMTYLKSYVYSFTVF